MYVLRVMGYSWGGEGQKSESVYFTVLGKFTLVWVNCFVLS